MSDILGTESSENLNGTNSADTIDGGGGNDIINSGAGNDILDGGSGSDRLNGGSGSDTLIYNLSENTGANDLYMGGSGIDTVKLELTVSEWESPIVQQEIREYLQHLAAVKTNINTGEVSNGTASDFTFDFGNGTTLTVSMMEKLVVVVNGETIDPHAPFITSGGAGATAAVSVAEDAAAITDVNAFDLDRNALTYEISAGNAGGLFTIDSEGKINVAAGMSLDYETQQQYVLTVKVSDGTGLFDTQNITINVTDVNEAPVAPADFAVAAAETVNDTTVLATVTGTDPDLGGGNDALNNFEDLSYAFQGDASGKFEIDAATGSISLKSGESLNYEAAQSHEVTVRVGDGPGLYDDVKVTINVTDVNEAPVAPADFAASALETVDDTTVLATVVGSDPDAGGGNDALNNFEDLSYAIQGDASGKFEIDAATGSISLKSGESLNYEAAQSHEVTVRVGDGPGLYDDVKVTINVTDVNEAPVAPADFAVAAAETVDDTTVLATVTGTDPDLGGGNDALNNFEDLSYSFSGGNPAGLFEIDAATGAISLASGKALDYETAQSHMLTVTVADGGTLNDTVNVTINVTDVVEGDPNDFDQQATSTTQVTTTPPGPSGDNTIRGSNFNDTLYGGAGADTLYGGAGDDVIYGGTGGDTLYGGSGNDTLRGEDGVDAIYGGSGNDTIEAGAGADVVILGGLGNDTITGGNGADTLSGGDGSDTFNFTSLSAGFGVDAITDFNANGVDMIALLSSAFASLAGGTTTGLDSDEFRANVGGTAVDGNDFILFDTGTGNIYYDSNGSAGGGRTQFATLTASGTIDYTDFTVLP